MFFTGAYDPKRERVRLKWATGSEIQSLNFELYRSIGSPVPGRAFEEDVRIATLSAAGNSSARISMRSWMTCRPGLRKGARIGI